MSSIPNTQRTKFIYAGAIAIPFLLLIVLAFFARQTVVSLENARQLVDRTFILKRDLALLLRTVVDAETGQRGYILTQREEFLEPYDEALVNVPIIRERIAETIIDPTAREIFRKVGDAIEARMKYSADVIEMQRNGDHEQTIALIRTGKGKALMDIVRARVDEFEKRQDYLLGVRQAQHHRTAQINQEVSWSLITLDLLFIGMMAYFLTKLRRAEAMLHVCAWSQTVEYEGEWLSYEEYLLRRFGIKTTHGISPAEAEKFFASKKARLAT